MTATLISTNFLCKQQTLRYQVRTPLSQQYTAAVLSYYLQLLLTLTSVKNNGITSMTAQIYSSPYTGTTLQPRNG